MKIDIKTLEYPRWMYGPNGEAQIFNNHEEVPKGWSVFQKSEAKDEVVADNPPTEALNTSIADEVATPLDEASESDVSPEMTKEYIEGLEWKKIQEIAVSLNVSKAGKKPEVVERIVNALEEAKKK